MQHQPILAAVDLGSNSFRLQVARVEGDQLYMLDELREPVRLAAGLTAEKYLNAEAQQRALAALGRFAERLRDLPREAVRAVGTNSLRVAKNAADFIPQAERTLGFPIEVIAGHEEARLIYLGVAHGLAQSEGNLLVMDIGGGSTEFIVGNGLTPLKLESLYMGSVSYSQRFFPDGKIAKQNLKQAELAARMEVQTIAADYRGQWQHALGSSGTAKAICEILELNGYSKGGISRAGLEQLRADLLKAGDVQKLGLQGLRPDRIPALAGGFAIMYAAFCELDIELMQPALGALREGVLYDLLGRFHDNDMRDVTVRQFMLRYRIDARQAGHVAQLAHLLARQFLGDQAGEAALHMLGWTARLHEIGISVAHSGYHKHTAYILANADMPGFSKKEQARLSLLALAQRGNLDKLQGQLKNTEDCVLAMSLRLAVLFYRNRSNIELPALQGHFSGTKFHLLMDAGWLAQNPLTETALQEEVRQWKTLEISFQPMPQ
ncbi:MAG: exopolyphosphatase [Gallionellales bacterium RIFCSPLOWO2_12_FULL_59_22]|nr:MAG: exopolyphosphatase [Gallionellales bacterium RIFCSPLOWO2_02_FULL_59_110]OGT01574.1 MAG: exopolyphosphatase [Gallionellales bacterium RIFCSPLOWO2_02_58_13]OGT12500.1 MAG: exopolyphosphatase [Gallionellales bacterium RIFCSPLOWO2_12_FULL_59_22]